MPNQEHHFHCLYFSNITLFLHSILSTGLICVEWDRCLGVVSRNHPDEGFSLQIISRRQMSHLARIKRRLSSSHCQCCSGTLSSEMPQHGPLTAPRDPTEHPERRALTEHPPKYEDEEHQQHAEGGHVVHGLHEDDKLPLQGRHEAHQLQNPHEPEGPQH